MRRGMRRGGGGGGGGGGGSSVLSSLQGEGNGERGK